MKPTPTFRFFFSDSSAALSKRRTRALGGERFLHEHVDPLVHGVLEVHRPEGGMRGQQHHVAGRRQSIAFL